MLTLFQYWFSCGCVKGWQQLQGHYGTLWCGNGICRDQDKDQASSSLTRGNQRLLYQTPTQPSRNSPTGKVRANLPSGVCAYIERFVSLLVWHRGFVWPLRQGTEQRGRCWRWGSAPLCPARLAPGWDLGQVLLPQSVSKMRSGLCQAPLTVFMANASAAAPSTHHPAGVPMTGAGVGYQTAKLEWQRAAGFPDPTEVSSTLLPQVDSAVDETPKLYWKQL